MKVRIDFVSNSSSTSYVLACQSAYLNDVIKDLARACTSKNDPNHDKMLAKDNQCILDFCLKTFRLLFIGDLVVKTEEVTYNLAYFERMFMPRNGKMTAELRKQASDEWKLYKKYLESISAGKDVDVWAKKEYGNDKYFPDRDEAIHYHNTIAHGLVVSQNIMEYHLIKWHFSNAKDPPDVIKERVHAILNMARHGYNDLIGNIGICQITQDTIDNTRDLLSMGYKIEFSEWEDLDELEAKIANGYALFKVLIADSGDGKGNFHIFKEDFADGVSGISGVDVLACECC